MKILVAGDIHGCWGLLNNLILYTKPDLILQVGDFGFWPRQDRKFARRIDTGNCRIYWCDGNHEDHDALQKRVSDEVMRNIIYMPRGSVLTLPDGRNALFMGGAQSVDKPRRTPGKSWFETETIQPADMDRLPNPDTIKIDIVISHTCPAEFDMGEIIDPDQSRQALSQILAMYKPEQWFFGHWHFFKRGQYKGCTWTCLEDCEASKWWVELK